MVAASETLGERHGSRIGRPARLRLQVFDVAGRRVRTLERQAASAGPFELQRAGETGTGERASSGIYFVRLDPDGIKLAQRRVVLMK